MNIGNQEPQLTESAKLISGAKLKHHGVRTGGSRGTLCRGGDSHGELHGDVSHSKLNVHAQLRLRKARRRSFLLFIA